MVKSSPAAGAVLTKAPPEVRAWFNDELAVKGSTLRLYDAHNKLLGTGGIDPKVAAAQDVRTAAIEEELNAIKARLATKTVQITGATEMRYDVSRIATGAALNGNPTTGSTSAGASPTGNMAREVLRLQFDGSAAENVHLIAVLITAGLAGTGASTGFVAFNSSDYGFPGAHVLGTIDDAFLDGRAPSACRWRSGSAGLAGCPPGRPTRSSSVPLAS